MHTCQRGGNGFGAGSFVESRVSASAHCRGVLGVPRGQGMHGITRERTGYPRESWSPARRLVCQLVPESDGRETDKTEAPPSSSYAQTFPTVRALECAEPWGRLSWATLPKFNQGRGMTQSSRRPRGSRREVEPGQARPSKAKQWTEGQAGQGGPDGQPGLPQQLPRPTLPVGDQPGKPGHQLGLHPNHLQPPFCSRGGLALPHYPGLPAMAEYGFIHSSATLHNVPCHANMAAYAEKWNTVMPKVNKLHCSMPRWALWNLLLPILHSRSGPVLYLRYIRVV